MWISFKTTQLESTEALKKESKKREGKERKKERKENKKERKEKKTREETHLPETSYTILPKIIPFSVEETLMFAQIEMQSLGPIV